MLQYYLDLRFIIWKTIVIKIVNCKKSTAKNLN